ncbi:thermonuclease family protein [Pontixanthobacter gangjinensis]|uniref:Thermonuclease family protein n=1 Tax=Pontixanthobacter gangjinensis TaxID=1028742 RepID=A0A6I4SKL2_9SPHN|nr:thermonuclease family protein [Pontixanthobacter gangjinensis]
MLVSGCCLAVFTAVFLWDSAPRSQAADVDSSRSVITTVTHSDTINAKFGICGAGPRSTCVVDGDTIWLYGTKIRIADINTPEVSNYDCQNESRLGMEATRKLASLLNEGPFSVETADRDEDKYGRKLRILSRDGKSLGAVLVDEGLAEEWNGERIDWC